MKKQIFIFMLLFVPLFNISCEEIPIKAEKLEILDEGNLWIGIGGVSLSWEDWEISSDELVLDYTQKQIIANGNVLIEKPEYMVYAESMDYDTQADYFKFNNAIISFI